MLTDVDAIEQLQQVAATATNPAVLTLLAQFRRECPACGAGYEHWQFDVQRRPAPIRQHPGRGYDLVRYRCDRCQAVFKKVEPTRQHSARSRNKDGKGTPIVALAAYREVRQRRQEELWDRFAGGALGPVRLEVQCPCGGSGEPVELARSTAIVCGTCQNILVEMGRG